MIDDITITLREEEWRTIVNALSYSLSRGFVPINGTNPFAIMDYVNDWLADAARSRVKLTCKEADEMLKQDRNLVMEGFDIESPQENLIRHIYKGVTGREEVKKDD